MANTFKSEGNAGVGTSTATVYTCPAATSTTVIGMSLANVVGTLVTADVTLVKNGGTPTVHLIKDVPLPTGSTSVIIGGDQKLVLETGDSVKVVSDTASSVDVVFSYLEIT